ncbi:endonuclease/exonuclease/phosphatase family protein [Arenibacter certesii]|uniref:Endonuclease/exonuclease/phosphatase domain-containing protein n=1 Tax=Arenibacter certesii TaxID=228955 RepID=A0A918J3D3_9FLAO|nr:endonuclease/exonuclease/phosphatase family protein [Arenibacter certesii]GGW45825.1 hypothetical protein GCM10007383_32650 [Arenibacter certesii]
MNLRYPILIFLFGITSIVFSQENLRILTFNIWDPADIPFWEKHANGYPVDKLVTYVTEDNADVLLFQEVTLEKPPHHQSYNSIKNKLFKKGYIYSAFYKPNGTTGYVPNSTNSGYPLAIFSKFPIEETFTTQQTTEKRMGKGLLGIKIRVNDKPLFIFNTHLNIGNHTTDEEISRVALPFIKKVTVNDMVIFAGDFNSPPAAEFPNSSKKIDDYTYSSQTTQFLIDAKFNDAWVFLPNNNKKGNGVTCPGQDDYIKRVDQVYFKGNGLKPTYAFAKRNLWESINLLDHNGVVVDFVIE